MSRVQTDLDLRFFTPQVRERTGGRLPGFSGPRVVEDRRAGEKAAQVAQALAQVNPALNRAFGQVHQGNIEDAIESAITDRARLRTTFEDAVDQGLIDESQSPFYREAWQERDGIVAARKFQSQMRQELHESGLINSDDPAEIAAFLDERSQALLEGSSRHYALGFASEYDAIADRLFNERDQRWIQNERAHSITSFQELTALEIEDALVAGAFDGSNPDALKALGERLTLLGQEAFENGSISGSDVNQALAAVIATVAEEFDLSEAQALSLAENVRTGPGGQSRLSSVLAVRRALSPLDEEKTAEELQALERDERRISLAERARSREVEGLFEGFVETNIDTIYGTDGEAFQTLLVELTTDDRFGVEHIRAVESLRSMRLSAQSQQRSADNYLSPTQQEHLNLDAVQLALNGGDITDVVSWLEAQPLLGPGAQRDAFSAFLTAKGLMNNDQYPTAQFQQSQRVVQGMLTTIVNIPETITNPAYEEWANLPASEREESFPPLQHLPNPEHPEWLGALDTAQKIELGLHMDRWVQARLNQALHVEMLGREDTDAPLTPQEIQNITNGVQAEALELIKQGGPAEFRNRVIEPAVHAQQVQRQEQAVLRENLRELEQNIKNDVLVPFEQRYADLLRGSERWELDPNTGPSDPSTLRADRMAFQARQTNDPTFAWLGSDEQKNTELRLGGLTTEITRTQRRLAELQPGTEEYRNLFNLSLRYNDMVQVVHGMTPPSLEYIETKTSNPDNLRTVGLSSESTYWAEYPLFWSEAELSSAVEEALDDPEHILRRILTNTGYNLDDPATLHTFTLLQRQRIQQAQQIGRSTPN